jgi:thymidine kinase
MVVEGEVVVVGNVDPAAGDVPEVVYEVLCRDHHRRRLTAARAPVTTGP